MPCVMNAANEMAVKMFMQEKIKFTDIPHIIEHALATTPSIRPKTIEEYIVLDAETRARSCKHRFLPIGRSLSDISCNSQRSPKDGTHRQNGRSCR